MKVYDIAVGEVSNQAMVSAKVTSSLNRSSMW